MLRPQVDFVLVLPLQFLDRKAVAKTRFHLRVSISGDCMLHEPRISDDRVCRVLS